VHAVPVLADVLAVLESRYPPGWAESWDAVGLVCGDPAQPVRRVLFAVDPVASVAEEAVRIGADLLVTHHPLFLTGVHAVAETTAKGRLVSSLVRAGVALHVVHTNADVAAPGVSDALAAALGLNDLVPLAPVAADPLDKVVTFVPVDVADRVIDAMGAAGAGAIGDYSRCAFVSSGVGTFRPGPAARPAVGERGQLAQVDERRVEMVLPRGLRTPVIAALRAAHPYEVPAFDVFELALPPGPRGLGRIGVLPAAESLSAFLRRAATALPPTVGGLRASGDPDREVRTVAVCGGAGDALLGQVAGCGADVFLTADLRHHPAAEHAEDGGPALVDAAHWATEWPWLGQAAELLASDLAALGEADTVTTSVSTRRTDPWTLHAGQ